MNGHGAHRDMVWQIAEDYAAAHLLLRLPGHCPMPAFREVEDVPLLVPPRTARRARRCGRRISHTPDMLKMPHGMRPHSLRFTSSSQQAPDGRHLLPNDMPKGSLRGLHVMPRGPSILAALWDHESPLNDQAFVSRTCKPPASPCREVVPGLPCRASLRSPG